MHAKWKNPTPLHLLKHLDFLFLFSLNSQIFSYFKYSVIILLIFTY